MLAWSCGGDGSGWWSGMDGRDGMDDRTTRHNITPRTSMTEQP